MATKITEDDLISCMEAAMIVEEHSPTVARYDSPVSGRSCIVGVGDQKFQVDVHDITQES
jgi:hypothetical protein